MLKYYSLMGTFTIPPPTSIPQTFPVFAITLEVYFLLIVFSKSTTTIGSTSSNGTMIEDIQVQTSEGKEIHLEKLGGILNSTPLFVV